MYLKHFDDFLLHQLEIPSRWLNTVFVKKTRCMAMYKFHLSDTKLILISGFKSGYFSNVEVAMATLAYSAGFSQGKGEGAEVSSASPLNFCL